MVVPPSRKFGSAKEAWDFELEAPSKSIDDHLNPFGVRLFNKWGSANCFVDSCYIPNDTVMANGTHHLAHIFDLARAAGASAVPVTGLDRSSSYQVAISTIVATDQRGACIRLTGEDFAQPIHSKVQSLMSRLKLQPGEVDLVVDVATDVLKNSVAQASGWNTLLNAIPFLAHYRTVTLAGSSIPSTFTAASLAANKYIDRSEWLAYKALVQLNPSRLPTFGDYGVLNPNMIEMDPRFIDPNAKIKYSTENSWYIALGSQVRKNGRAQYSNLCHQIINERPVIFGGPTYCNGDLFIDQCANGGSTGGTSTWPTVTTNRHISVTVKSIATHFGHVAPT